MERVPGACAKEWSIDLETGLRSKELGRRTGAIEEIGKRLHQWTKDPPPMPRSVSDMFGLVPGEDTLFANSILLRLAHAFRTGDNSTRVHILKAFLLESNHLQHKGKGYNGILAKGKVANQDELLSRVKAVLDGGDIRARCLALRLIGCWSDFAHHNTHMRHVVLSSLLSTHAPEVKAALFAAGCFSRLSEDFAIVVLEIFIDIISSSRVLHDDLKLAAIGAFAKMTCSLSIARRAYNAGKKLIFSSLKDDLKGRLMLSLSKIAVGSTLLTSEQVHLLLQFVSHEAPHSLRSTAFKCLSFILNRAYNVVFSNTDLVPKLLNTLDDKDQSSNFHLETMLILGKIFRRMPPGLRQRRPVVLKLVQILKEVAQSPIKTNRHAVLGLLSNIMFCYKTEQTQHACFSSEKCRLSSQKLVFGSGEDSPACDLCCMTQFLFDFIDFLLKEIDDVGYVVLSSPDLLSEVNQQCNNSIKLLLYLVEMHPTTCLITLDRSIYYLEFLLGSHERFNLQSAPVSHQGTIALQANPTVALEYSTYKERKLGIYWNLVLHISRFITFCLRTLDGTDMVSSEVNEKLKLVLDSLDMTIFGTSHELFRLSIGFYRMQHCCDRWYGNTLGQRMRDNELDAFQISWVSQERSALAFAQKTVKKSNYWEAYRAAKYSCCEGLWFAPAFIFRKLIDCVQTDSCRCWFRSLMFLAGCESEIKLLRFPKAGVQLIHELRGEGSSANPLSCIEKIIGCCIEESTTLHDLELQITKLCIRLRTSEEILAIPAASDGVYYFQRWFLILRVKVLRALEGILGILNSHSIVGETDGSKKTYSKTSKPRIHFLASGLSCASIQLNKISKDYDLLATSFLDIDCQSFRTTCKLSLHCSLLSFCTAFAFPFTRLPASTDLFDDADLKNSSSLILQNLVERLCNIENKFVIELQQFLSASGKVVDNLQSRTQCSYIDRGSLLIYEDAISSILRIHEDSKAINDENELYVLLRRGLQSLAEIIKKWMKIPLQIPKYYFYVRPCIGAELFAFNADSKRKHDLSVSCGFQLSLDLCLQLRNLPPKVKVVEMHCILAASSFQVLSPESGEVQRQPSWTFQPSKSEETIELSEQLMHYLRMHANKRYQIHHGSRQNVVTAFVSFDPNEKGQGFSSCLLDVSSFSEGSYQIKWHSCCIDNKGACWSLLPLNSGLSFSIRGSEC